MPLLFVLLAVTGCLPLPGGATRQKAKPKLDLVASAKKLSVGMTEDEVRKAIGKPDQEGYSPMGGYTMTYATDEDILIVMLENSVVKEYMLNFWMSSDIQAKTVEQLRSEMKDLKGP